MHLFPVLAAAAPQPSPLMSLLPIILIFAVFYFLIIKPQKQKQAAHQKMMEALKKNDEIITIGGIYGTVVNVKEKTVTVRIADTARIELQKSAVAGLRKNRPEVSGDDIATQSE